MIIALIAAVTSLLVAILICAAIMGRQQPCFLRNTVVLVGESRIQGGNYCSGKPENLYLSTSSATAALDGMRACEAHRPHLQDAADALVRQSN